MNKELNKLNKQHSKNNDKWLDSINNEGHSERAVWIIVLIIWSVVCGCIGFLIRGCI